MLHKLISIVFVISCFVLNLSAQTPPKREFRAAWLATYANIDWPSSGASTATEQSTYIQRMEEHRVTGMNAVFVQIRSQCDAMYPSPYEPWSADLTGTQGTAPNPYYDPLEFMINETKKKGMEFHAWINPYRALANASTSNLNALSPNHIINTQPGWIMSAGTQRILNPGIPAVWDYVIKVVMDVVRRYDVDGIHFDDYFYPYPSAGTYNDDAEFALYNRGIATKADWRRSNVDSLIKRLNDSIKLAKPWVKFGISPSGIWLSASTSPANPAGSNTSSGATQHYKDLFANSRLWIQQGWVDYLIPQVYWYIGQTGSDYNILIPWWNNNAFGRNIYSGMAGYKVGEVAQDAQFETDKSQIPNQVRLNRQNANIKGSVIYNTTSLRNNKLGFRDSLQQFFFNRPALQPLMTWKDNTPPAAAISLTATQNGLNIIDLLWVKPTDAVNELDKAKRFAIYRSTSPTIDISNANNLIGITWKDTSGYRDNTVQQGTQYYYVITALDRFQNESTVSNTATITTLPLQLISFSFKRKNTTIELNWATENELNCSHFEIEKADESLHFAYLNKVTAKNNTTNNYIFNDDINKQTGITYYRMKMMDKDDRFTYSPVLRVPFVETKAIKIYPTILSKGGLITVNIGQNKIDKVNYSIADITGKIIQTTNISINYIAVIKLKSELPSGMYFLKILNNGELLKQSTIIIQ
jgi:uncharacterized lipoprotein YddW (UPF0748 family)